MGASLESSLERERTAASEELDFERAAAIHKKLEKATAAMRNLPELARRVDELDAIVMQRGGGIEHGRLLRGSRRSDCRAIFPALR